MTGDRQAGGPLQIREDDPNTTQLARLLREHLQDVARHSPPESVHALDLEALSRPDVTVWSACKGTELVGCAALKDLGDRHGEIKSMRTAAAHRREGVAAHLLRHIVAEARRRHYRRLSLETGSAPAFAPARSLYRRFGFETCAPFGDYVEDPHSVFMTRCL